MPLESVFKRRLIAKIQKQFPGAIVLKIDANFIQGIPDQFIIHEDCWASFEAKRSRFAHHQPNQDYYVDLLNEMSLCRFVYPENEQDFLHELQQTFRPSRATRVFKR